MEMKVSMLFAAEIPKVDGGNPRVDDDGKSSDGKTLVIRSVRSTSAR